MDSVAASLLRRVLGQANGHIFGTATLLVNDRCPRGTAGLLVLASSTIVIAIRELQLLFLLGRDMEMVNREALVRAGDDRVALVLLAGVASNAFTLKASGEDNVPFAITKGILALVAFELRTAILVKGAWIQATPIITLSLLLIAMVVGV